MNESNDRAAWFKGGSACCGKLPTRPKQLHRLVLLGAPGVGKGTQTELICARLGACHLSTGDVFRAAKQLSPGELNPELEKAFEYMRRGELAPDETALELARQRAQCLRCSRGFGRVFRLGRSDLKASAKPVKEQAEMSSRPELSDSRSHGCS